MMFLEKPVKALLNALQWLSLRVSGKCVGAAGNAGIPVPEEAEDIP